MEGKFGEGQGRNKRTDKGMFSFVREPLHLYFSILAIHGITLGSFKTYHPTSTKSIAVGLGDRHGTV